MLHNYSRNVKCRNPCNYILAIVTRYRGFVVILEADLLEMDH